MKLIENKKFVITVLNVNDKAFVIHINSLAIKNFIYLVKKAQIFLLLIKKITIPQEYFFYVDIFLKKLF